MHIFDVDDLLVERVAQPLARSVRRRTGLDNFAAAFACVNIAFALQAPVLALVARMDVASWQAQDLAVAPAYVINAIVPVLVLAALRQRLSGDTDIAARAVRNGREPPAKRRFETRQDRAFAIAGTALPAAIMFQCLPVWAGVLCVCAFLASVAGAYLLACVPDPPRDGRQKRILAVLRLSPRG